MRYAVAIENVKTFSIGIKGFAFVHATAGRRDVCVRPVADADEALQVAARVRTVGYKPIFGVVVDDCFYDVLELRYYHPEMYSSEVKAFFTKCRSQREEIQKCGK